MNICVIGAGHVGLVTGACFADLGHKVVCVDNDTTKIRMLKSGKIPFYEPGLSDMVKRNYRKKRLAFSTNLKEGVAQSKIIFIAVGTPSRENGDADLSYVENVSRSIAQAMRSYRLIVEKSTVPVETGKWVKHTIDTFKKQNVDFDIASNPEFLREGSAIEDSQHPDRIVIGVETKRAEKLLLELYRPFRAPIVVTDLNSAELIKHASNSFLAAKISFINAVSIICEKVGADIVEVARGVGLDRRINGSFFNAGLGFGGPCFPKDLDAFIRIAEKAGYDFKLLKAVQDINEEQKRFLIKKIEQALWNLTSKSVCILGLSFKPDTDDMRTAPSLDIIAMLKKEGVSVRAYDPQAAGNAKKLLKGVELCATPYAAAKGCDCLVIVTEWDEFKRLDLAKLKKIMRQPIIIDGRNLLVPEVVKKAGFKYTGIGRR